MSDLDHLIHRADLDELIRHVDNTVATKDWDHLVRVRNAARAALDTGRPLWPIATLSNFRLALWAPAEHAVRALDDTARTFMPGPVSEILAVHHTWDELEPFLMHGHDRSLVAYERAMRGDVIEPGEPAALDIDIMPADWEPRYALATYSDDGGQFPAPQLAPSYDTCECDGDGEDIDDSDVVSAFRQLVDPWTANSNGRADVVVVEGDGIDALSCLGLDVVRLTPVTSSDALAHLAWAGASGGAHGRRRGGATGRFGAWWLMCAVAGLSEEWPVSNDDMNDVLASMTFAWWDVGEPRTGWELRLVIEDPDEGIAVAFAATDGK